MVQEKLRAVFYARVSTEEERQLNALEKQVAECKDAVLQKGWKLVDQYVDEGKSGTQIKRRDEYRRLFEDLENDKFDIVVIKSQDRLQRNTLDWYIWIDRLTTHGKRLYMYLEDTFYSPDNALISGIKAILAEEYSRELSKKINNSYKRRIEAAKNGEKISIVNNSRSLGYDKVNGELVINEKEAEIVRMIFNMYVSGEGLRAISNTLYDMGYRNRSGNEIDPTTISRMLSSEKYKGVYVINQRHYDFDTKKTVLILKVSGYIFPELSRLLWSLSSGTEYRRSKDLKYRVLKMRNVVGIVVRVSLAVKSTVLSVGLNIGDL